MITNRIKSNPFTTTPGVAGDAYINPHCADEIIQRFDDPSSTNYVYKILGLRGSGKSVEFAKVINYYCNKEDWLVYTLAASGDPLQTMVDIMSSESSILSTPTSVSKTVTGEVEASAIAIHSNVSGEITKNYGFSEIPSSYDARFQYLCRRLSEKKKILIGIDDIAKTDEMVHFLSVLNSIILNKSYRIRLICTGLEKNIEKFNDIDHLSFFARPEPKYISGIDLNEIELKYYEYFGISKEDAEKLAKITKGYAWGYQLFGNELFQSKDNDLEEIFYRFDKKMAPTYSLIWKDLSPEEKQFIKIVLNQPNGVAERSIIEPQIKGYSQHRKNLIAKHVLSYGKGGIVSVELPRFKEFIGD